MRTVLRILKTELKVFFYSPIAWLILVIFAFQVGAAFCNVYESEFRYQDLGYSVRGATQTLIGGSKGIFSNMLETLYLYIPLLTMGLMSREFNSGSVKLLYSSPVSNSQIILGKYLSMIVFSLILVAILMLPTVFIGVFVKHADTKMMLVGGFGIFITLCAYSAIGLFMSTITRSQVVAVISTMIVLAMLNFIGQVGQQYDLVRDMTYWLSISGRSSVFIQGLLSTKELAYFVLVISMFLFLSIIKLRGERLHLPVWNSALSYIAVLAAVFVLGLATSLPKFSAYYDATQAKTNTLTPYSQEVMSRITDGLSITTYGNILDETSQYASPENRNRDLRRFDQYRRFKPELKQNYVTYYGKYYSNSRYRDSLSQSKTPYELMLDIARRSRKDPASYLPEDEVFKMDDISDESGRFVRVIRRGNGQTAILRIYNDTFIHPFEVEITTAMKTLVDKSPVVAFVTGHGERNCYDYGEKGYGMFSTLRTSRSALINAGFTIRDLTFDAPVPDEVDIVFISDMKSALTDAEMEHYTDYLERGGNMVILGEPRRQAYMNPLVEPLGVRFADNMLVRPTDLYAYDFIPANITPEAMELGHSFASLAGQELQFTTSSACAIVPIERLSQFAAVNLFATDPEGVWIETETFDFVNDRPQLDRHRGETEGSYVVGAYFTRQKGDREQRIFVVGDADSFSAKELSAGRTDIQSGNFSVLYEFMRMLTYGEYPIRIDRAASPDTEYTATYGTLPWMKAIYKWAIPAALLIAAVTILLRRKRK